MDPQDRARRAAVATMLGARSMALVGASARPGSLGERMIIEARRGSARVQLVNPRYDWIGDLRCVPTLADLEEPVDLALMGVPDNALLDQLETAAATGVRSAVLFGSAVGLREKVAEIAARAGMAICGAGCMGFVNNRRGVRALGYLEPDPLPRGGISLVTHSGSAFSTMLRARRGFGFALAVSSGQELVTSTADYVEYALDEPDTRVIALLMESPRYVPRLRRALLRAADRDVPVVVLAIGGSPRGRAMVAAHSGALAGEAAGWAAFCAAAGAVAVRDLAEFGDTIELFAAGRRARARGIATVHDSGAERALVADVAHDLGVEFADLAAGTVSAIGEQLDAGLVATNPLDVWGTGADTRGLFANCLSLMAADPGVGATALAVDLVTEFDGDTAYPDALLDVAATTDAALAVLACVPSAIDADTAARLRGNGIPVLEGARTGLAALGHLVRWPLPRIAEPVVLSAHRQRRWRTAIAAGDVSAEALLADYGVPVTDTCTAASADEAAGAAAAIGYPVALKTVGAGHKSDVGGVLLDIADEAALRAGYARMAAALGPAVSVSAMVGAGVEISIGFVRDEVFGPLVVVAAGGTLVELLADRVVACPPVSPDRARDLLAQLRIHRLLAGWRGDPPCDTAALAAAITGIAELATELGDVLDAVEANPVIVSPGGAVAVDALLIPRRRISQ
ncbi:MAG: acetate--CoA ligase family protein [Actinobacteria bacterium]|nr:acetate--CoA ligase family protein [Actinomycetota bacterium]